MKFKGLSSPGRLYWHLQHKPIKNNIMKLVYTLILALMASAGFSQEVVQDSSGHSFDPAEFDDYLQQAVEDWDVPGLAVAVIHGDSVIFGKGYGTREAGKDKPVNMETLFAVASTTKAFTAASIGMLVDEGQLDWDDPVVKHLPEFQLRDSNLTPQITVRDLLTHRAGLPNTDFMWFDPETPAREMIRRLDQVKTAYPLRSGFIYQNVMYAVAGEVIEAVSGIPWDQFIQTRIFTPLLMDRSIPFQAGIQSENVASPHDYAEGELIVVENSQADEIGPAGSVWSSAGDMSRWIRFLLRGCKTQGGEQLLSESSCEEMFTPQVVLPEPMYPTAELTDPHWSTYGLGWFQQDYEGRKVDFHTGSLSGMVAIAGMIRDEDLGVYVLGNRDHAEIRHAIMYRVFDLFDEEAPRDWSRELKGLYDNMEDQQELTRRKRDSAQVASRVPGTGPSLSLSSYTGTYRHPLYGTVEISTRNEDLRFRYGSIQGTLEHWHYDTFRMINDKLESQGRPMIDFDLNISGEAETVNWGSWEFSRVPQD